MKRTVVIKPETSNGTTPRLRAFNLSDYHAEADAILTRAREEGKAFAFRVRKASERKAAELFEEKQRAGYDAGFIAGQEAGRAEALEAAKADYAEKLSSLESAMGNIVDVFESEKRGWLAAAHRDMVDLSLEVARRVVKRIGAVDREVAAANLEQIIDRVGRRRVAAVRVNAVDLESIRTFAEKLAAEQPAWRHVTITADETIEPGGCSVALEEGDIDATLDTQLDRIISDLVTWEAPKA